MANNLPQLKSLVNNKEVKSRVVAMLGDKDSALFLNSILSVVTAGSLQDCEPSSVVSCALRSCSLGLSIDPAMGLAYLVGYKDKEGKKICTLQIGVGGYIALAMRSGSLEYFFVSEIYADEMKRCIPALNLFEFNETPSEERYKATAEPIGYYAEFKTLKGFVAKMYMTKSQMERYRDQYSKSYKMKPSTSLWTTEFVKMCKKTIARQLLWQYRGIFSISTQSQLQEATAADDNSENIIDNLDNEIPEEKKAKGRKIQRDDDIIDAVVADKEEAEKEMNEELEAFGN